MTSRFPLLLTVFIAGACASAGPTQPAPQPQPQRETTPPPVVAPPVVTPTPPPATLGPREAAVNWQLLDATADRMPGISLERAQRELLAGKAPKRTVVVAIIDGGVDTAHVDLRSNLWLNPRETAGNGRDDDNNGYVDDVYGWNFIGGRDGRSVHWDTFEVTRLHALCLKKAPEVAAMPCDSISKSFQKKKTEAEQTLTQVNMIAPAWQQSVALLKQALRTDSLTLDAVQKYTPASAALQQAKGIFVQLAANGVTTELINNVKQQTETQVKYNLDPNFDPRPIVGDNYADLNERRYGNRDVTGPDSDHGTHVAGIIGAVRGNGIGVDGIATGVKLMAVRAVPDGDERDKDVANAIRYAVDAGAQVINMSFGKAWSPGKPAVDAAAKYADSKGVLIIHAAGNDGENLAVTPSFPVAKTSDGTRVANWIEVGASSWKGADTLAADFSNYGREQVDVFAPGVDILSTMPGGKTGRQSGTSMAAPVVSGLAALIMSHYPELTAADVKKVILDSATKLGDRTTLLPGEEGRSVAFGTLSATGGVVNAYNALRMAEQVAASKR